MDPDSISVLPLTLVTWGDLSAYNQAFLASITSQTLPRFDWVLLFSSGNSPEDALTGLDSRFSQGQLTKRSVPEKEKVHQIGQAFYEAAGEVTIYLETDTLAQPPLLEMLAASLQHTKNAVAARLKTSKTVLALRTSFAKPFAKADTFFGDSLFQALKEPGKLLVIDGQHTATADTSGLHAPLHLPEVAENGLGAAAATGTFLTPKKWPPCGLAPTEPLKLHIAFLFPWMVMGGADKFNLALLQGLDKEKFELSVFTTLPSQNEWKPQFEAITPAVFCLCDFLEYGAFANFLCEYIEKKRVNLLFVSNSDLGYHLAPWLKAQFPCLALVNYVHADEPAWRSGGYARLSGVLSGVFQATYTSNENTRQILIDTYGHKEHLVRTIYAGVDTAYYTPVQKTGGQIYEEFGISPARPIILFPCRIAPEKRPFLLLAIAQCMQNDPIDPVFMVVGDGTLLPLVKQKAQEMKLEKTVYFAGQRADLRPFYAAASLALICSSSEGLAFTTYESMACGTPVVSSDVGGQKELVSEETGTLVPIFLRGGEEPVEKEALRYAAAIRTLLQAGGQLARRGEKARQVTAEHFSHNRMTTLFAEEFTRLCAPENRRQTEQITKELQAQEGVAAELAVLGTEYARLETQVAQVQQQYTNTKALLQNSFVMRLGQKVIHLLDTVKGFARR